MGRKVGPDFRGTRFKEDREMLWSRRLARSSMIRVLCCVALLAPLADLPAASCGPSMSGRLKGTEVDSQ
jgi:hypothetical protein